MRKVRFRISASWLIALALPLAACTGSTEDVPIKPEGEQSSAAPAAATDEEPEPKAEGPSPCPDETVLTIARLDRSPYLDGVATTFTPKMAFANVSFDRDLEIAFASYEIERSQFGLVVPTGHPKVPEGGLIYRIRIGAKETLVPGLYTEEDKAPGRIQHHSMYHSRGRINPIGHIEVRITEVTEESVCGEVLPTGNALWPTVSGKFKLNIVR